MSQVYKNLYPFTNFLLPLQHSGICFQELPNFKNLAASRPVEKVLIKSPSFVYTFTARAAGFFTSSK